MVFSLIICVIVFYYVLTKITSNFKEYLFFIQSSLSKEKSDTEFFSEDIQAPCNRHCFRRSSSISAVFVRLFQNVFARVSAHHISESAEQLRVQGFGPYIGQHLRRFQVNRHHLHVFDFVSDAEHPNLSGPCLFG